MHFLQSGGIPGVDQVFKSALRHFRFIASKQKLHVTNSSCTATFFTGAIVPTMWDPHQLLDYDNWWKKELNNIRPYVVPPATVDLIAKMEVQLEDSSNLIGNTRANGEQIVQHLQSLINELKVEQTFPFVLCISATHIQLGSVYNCQPKFQN